MSHIYIYTLYGKNVYKQFIGEEANSLEHSIYNVSFQSFESFADDPMSGLCFGEFEI